MPVSAAMVGALLGLGTQMYSNALRKLPYMRHPWEHVLVMGLGAVFANQMVKWDAKSQEDLDKLLLEARQANHLRYFGDDCGGLENLKKFLAKEFEIKDLGNLKYFLGMEFARSKEGIVVSQKKYVFDLLNDTGMMGCRLAETPMESNLKLQPASAEKVRDREKFQRLVGKLIYLAHTRPDMAFPVSIVSQFMHSLGPEHFEAVHRILRYLKGTPGKGIFFKAQGHLKVKAYTDADWAGCIIYRRSTSGYCTYVGGSLVTWRSKK